MSLRSFIQDHPAPLVWAWEITARVLALMRPIFERVGVERSSRIVKPPEEFGKHLLFNCQNCAQCVLHYTGMTCPMNCPKSLRNGPCGGVRLDGKCEVKPEMDCVWVKAYDGAQRLIWAHEFHDLRPPVDWAIQGSSSWINLVTGRDQIRSGCLVEPRSALQVVEEHGH